MTGVGVIIMRHIRVIAGSSKRHKKVLCSFLVFLSKTEQKGFFHSKQNLTMYVCTYEREAAARAFDHNSSETDMVQQLR